MAEQKVTLASFIRVAELLDRAFPDSAAVPDYLSHDCERAEQALQRTVTRPGYTSDPLLARLFDVNLDPET